MSSSSASFSCNPWSVKSRTIKPIVACSSAPEIEIGCRKPCLPSVVSGEQESFRQPIDDGRRNLDRVLHLALGKTGMGRDAFDGDGGAVGRESLVLDMARGLAVHGVGEIGAELFQVGLVDAAADLLVGREQDLDGAVLDLGMRHRNAAASMISARPALLSAPSSVVPSVVTMSLPI